MKISVVMTCYNSEKYIKEQLDSIFLELPEDSELIICDDCSSDNTINVVKSNQDSRIRFFTNKYNLGANKNFERCLSKATGDIIVIADSDNVWLPGKIRKILPFFDDKKVNMVMHDAIITDENLNPVINSYFEWRNSKPGLIRNIIKNGYGGSMMTFRSSCLKHILPFPKNMPFFFDEWIGMMCEKYGKCVFVSEKLSYWRRHKSTVSSSNIIKSNHNDKKPKRYFKIKYPFIVFFDRLKKIWFVMIR